MGYGVDSDPATDDWLSYPCPNSEVVAKARGGGGGGKLLKGKKRERPSKRGKSPPRKRGKRAP